jgi:putative endonuclease
MNEPAFVYILANAAGNALHVGTVTQAKLYVWYQRVKYHPKGFSAPYVFEKLVYYEIFEDQREAHKREKEIKALSRIGQRKLVENTNTGWNNLLDIFMQKMEDPGRV